MEPTIEITDRWGLRVVLCANAETLLDGYLEMHDTDAAHEVVEAGDKAASDKCYDLGLGCCVCESDSVYNHWHGGKYAAQAGNPSLRGRHICGIMYTRTADPDPDDPTETLYGDWAWVANANVPADIKATVKKILDAADDAMTAELDRLSAAESEAEE